MGCRCGACLATTFQRHCEEVFFPFATVNRLRVWRRKKEYRGRRNESAREALLDATAIGRRERKKKEGLSVTITLMLRREQEPQYQAGA